MFSHIVITAPTESIALVYQMQLNLLKLDSGNSYLQYTQLYSISDPEGYRVGSGGGTLNAVDFLLQNVNTFQIETSKVLIIHSGGDSRRAPLYSLCGKAWIGLNSLASPLTVANPVLLLINEITLFCHNLPKGSLVVASSDVLLHISLNGHGPAAFASDVISVVCVPEIPSIAKNHGVFVPNKVDFSACPSSLATSRYSSARAARYLQKPSEQDMQSCGALWCDAGGAQQAMIDTGVVIFTGSAFQKLSGLLASPVVSRCTSRHIVHQTTEEVGVLRLELYSDILLATAFSADTTVEEAGGCGVDIAKYMGRLGVLDKATSSDPALLVYEAALSELWSTFNRTALHYIFAADGCFEHLGTTREVLGLLNTPHSHQMTGGSTHDARSKKLALMGAKYGLQASVCSRLLLHSEAELSEDVVDRIANRSTFVNSFVAVDRVLTPISESTAARICQTIETQRFSQLHNPNYSGYQASGACADPLSCSDDSSASFVEHSLLSYRLLSILPAGSIVSHLSSPLSHLLVGRTASWSAQPMLQRVFVRPSARTTSPAVRGNPFVLLCLDLNDDIKAHYRAPMSSVCGSSWDAFFRASGCSAQDVWPEGVVESERSLWTACIFPLCLSDASGEVVVAVGDEEVRCDSVSALLWFQGIQKCAANDSFRTSDGSALWRKATRMSLADILRCGDARKMLFWRVLLGTAYNSEFGQLDRDRRGCQEVLLHQVSTLFDSLMQFLAVVEDILLPCSGDSLVGLPVALSLWCVELLSAASDPGKALTQGDAIQQLLQTNSTGTDVDGIIAAFEDFHRSVQAAGNSSELSLLCVHYLRAMCCTARSSNQNDWLVLVSDALVLVAHRFRGAVQPRLLFILSWLWTGCPSQQVPLIQVEPLVQRSKAHGRNVDGVGLAVLKDAWALLRPHLHRHDQVTEEQRASNVPSVSTILEAVGQRIVSLHTQHSLEDVHLDQMQSVPSDAPAFAFAPQFGSLTVACAPVRIDLAGGWSDTPPICYELGGAVLNVAVLVDGVHPIKCASRTSVSARTSGPPQPPIVLRTFKLRQSTQQDVLEGFDLLRCEEVAVPCFSASDFYDLQTDSPCVLLKAVLVTLGVVSSVATIELLQDRLNRLLGGPAASHVRLEIDCVSTLPAGSGMGGSSVLAATVLQSLGGTLGVPLDQSALTGLTSQVEQLMTTGGGWQDQIGSIYGGFKIARSSPSLPLAVRVQPVSTSSQFVRVFEERTFLLYTGQQRLARNTLINALRRCALVPTEDASEGRDTVSRLVQGAEKGAQQLSYYHSNLTTDNTKPNVVVDNVWDAAIQTVLSSMQQQEQDASSDEDSDREHNALDELAATLNNYWELKREMASGSEPHNLRVILDHVRGLCQGVSLCGAGAGGFAVLIVQRDVSRRHLQQCVDQLNMSLGRGGGEQRGLESPVTAKDDGLLTLHGVTVDLVGITSTQRDDSTRALATYL